MAPEWPSSDPPDFEAIDLARARSAAEKLRDGLRLFEQLLRRAAIDLGYESGTPTHVFPAAARAMASITR